MNANQVTIPITYAAEPTVAVAVKTPAARFQGRGRGSNARSKANLTGAPRDAYVYERGSGIGWSKLAGPTTYRAASRMAARLEAMNASDCKPMYAAMRGEVL